MCRSKAEGGRRCHGCTIRRLAPAVASGPVAPSAPGVPPPEWENVDAAALTDEYGAAPVRWALELAAAALRAEPRITADVVAAVPAGARCEALSTRLKAPSSLARKLAGRFTDEPDRRDHEAVAGRIDDVVRYTVVTDDADSFADHVAQHAAALRAAGYTLTDADHSFHAEAMYKGVHLSWRSPGGHAFEVQHHTAASIVAKEPSHKLYEISRSRAATVPERRAAREQLRELATGVPDPPGIDALERRLGVQLARKMR
ncbi:MAG: hypothetical protein QM679_11955 [Patulibacter sp.]